MPRTGTRKTNRKSHFALVEMQRTGGGPSDSNAQFSFELRYGLRGHTFRSSGSDFYQAFVVLLDEISQHFGLSFPSVEDIEFFPGGEIRKKNDVWAATVSLRNGCDITRVRRGWENCHHRSGVRALVAVLDAYINREPVKV